MSMSVEGVQVATRVLKARIDDLIQQFEEETKCTVQEIFVGCQDVTTATDTSLKTIFTGVHISVGIVE